MLVAGVDSSTQSTKVVLCRAEDGAVVGAASAPHPDGTECDPAHWWQALGRAGEGLLEQASATTDGASHQSDGIRTTRGRSGSGCFGTDSAIAARVMGRTRVRVGSGAWYVSRLWTLTTGFRLSDLIATPGSAGFPPIL